jgi:hypothetical protein
MVIIIPIEGTAPSHQTLRNMTMKAIKTLTIAAAAALSLMSAASFAQTVSATSTTLDGAEAKIAAQAQQQGAQYKILEASTNNLVHMTAELYK